MDINNLSQQKYTHESYESNQKSKYICLKIILFLCNEDVFVKFRHAINTRLFSFHKRNL